MSLINQLHPIDPEVEDVVDLLVATGRNVASEKRLEVGIIARDCCRAITRTLRTVDAVSQHFGVSNVRILTNDCADDTPELIGGYQPHHCRIDHRDMTFNRPHLGGTRETARTVALAEYRNIVREMMEPADYVLVLDADLLEVTEQRLMAGLGDLKAWGYDAVAAQNLALVPAIEKHHLISYDAFAFRPTWTTRSNYMIERAFHYDVRPAGAEAYNVGSAFGGACWYTGVEYFDRTYCGKDGCEHVSFNLGIDMGISPTMSLIGFI